MLADRLAKRMKHLAKWGRKQGISCFRLYERDIPEYPLVVDWYGDLGAENPATDGDAVAWFHDRKRDDDLDEALCYRRSAEAEILSGLGIPRSRLFVKHRGRQRNVEGGREQYERIGTESEVKFVLEHGSKFEISLTDYLDVGLFLDHRPTRRSVRERSGGKRVLNLFAYTGAFSVHAGRWRDEDHHRRHVPDLPRLVRAEPGPERLRTGRVPLDQGRLPSVAQGRPRAGRGLRPRHLRPAHLLQLEAHEGRPFSIVATIRSSCMVARFVAPGGEVFFDELAPFELDPVDVPEGFGAHEISHRSVPEDFRNRKIHRCWRLAEGWTPKERRGPRPTGPQDDSSNRG